MWARSPLSESDPPSSAAKAGTSSAFPRRRSGLLMTGPLLLGLMIAAPGLARADAGEADRAASAAREAVSHWRQAEAAVLFQRAIDQDPPRRMQWLRELADALSLSDRAREALPLYHEVLAAKGLSAQETTWAKLGLARALAFADKARQAIPIYRAVLADGSLSADDRRSGRLGLAQALAWSGQHRAALREYEALIQQNPKDMEVLLKRAELLSWMDRKTASKRAYEAILSLDPGNLDAQRKLAQLQSWRNERRDARRRLETLVRENPDDPEGTYLLAEYEDSVGRPDQALETVHDFVVRHSQDARAGDLLARSQKLLDRIRFNEQPDAGVDYQSSTQTDNLDIAVVSVQQNTQLHGGRTTVGSRYQRYDYSPPAGQIPIAVNRPGLSARHRISERSEINGSLFLDMIDPERGARSRRVLTYETYYTLWPNRHYRFDFGSRRTTFDNITSLTRGITGTYGSYSIDYLPDELLRLTVRGDWGDYSDGNSRLNTQVEAERQVWPNPHLFLGARFTDFAFSKLLDDGYYNPSSYRAAVLTFHLWGDRGPRIHYDIDGSYGREQANPDGGKPSSSLGGRLSYRLSPRMQIEGRWQFFSSRQAIGAGSELSSSGFARHTVGLFLRLIM